MSEEEKFLARWSRLKRQPREQPADAPSPAGPAVYAGDAEAPPPELPPVEQLTIDSDFRVFFHPKVDENLRRAALKKLFSDPHFNVMDGLDTYIGDYSKSDPLPDGMLAGLRQAQQILAWAREDTEKTAAQAAARVAAQAPALPEEQRTAPITAAVQPTAEALSEIRNLELPATPARGS
jgi:hypothetical protein